MGGSVFTPKQKNWRVYADAAGPTTPLANENTKPTLAGSSIIRIRVSIAETGGKASNNAVTILEYSVNQTDWFSLGAAAHWDHANGADADQSLVSSLLLTDSGASGEYCESTTSNVSYGASAVTENDMAVVPTANVTAGTTYYFRTLVAGTAVPLDTAETYPQVLTASVTNVTVSAGLASGAGSVQASTQSGAANISAGLVSVAGAAFAPSVLFDNVFSVGLVSCTGTTFAVEVVISGGDVIVSLGLVSGSATVQATGVSGDASTGVGLVAGSGAVFATAQLCDQILPQGMLSAGATAFTVSVSGDANVSLGLIAAIGEALAATVSGDANVDLGLIESVAAMFGAELILDSTIGLGLVEGGATILTVTVDVGGGNDKPHIKKTINFKIRIINTSYPTLPDT